MLKRLVITVFTACISALIISNSPHAQMAGPRDFYEPASPTTIRTLKSVRQTKPFLIEKSTKVFVFSSSPKNGGPLYFVRFEMKRCDDWCPTAIFENSISENTFRAFVVIPRKASRSDRGRTLCSSCKTYFSLIFIDDDGNSKGIAFTKHGLIF